MKMRMPTKLLIVTVVGAGALLIAALAGIVASRPQIAYAQNPQPSVHIDLNNVFGNAKPGQTLAFYTFRNFQSVTCDKNVGGPHHTSFDDVCYHRTEIYDRATNNRNSDCEQGLGGPRSFQKGDGIEFVYKHAVLPSSCPTEGQYILKVILMGSDKVEVASAIEYFGVNVNPEPTPIVTNTPTRTPTATPPAAQHNHNNSSNRLSNNNRPQHRRPRRPAIRRGRYTHHRTTTTSRPRPRRPRRPVIHRSRHRWTAAARAASRTVSEAPTAATRATRATSNQQSNNGGNQGGNQGNGNQGNQGRQPAATTSRATTAAIKTTTTRAAATIRSATTKAATTGVTVKSFISYPTPLPSNVAAAVRRRRSPSPYPKL